MKIEVKHSGKEYKSFRAEKVKSLFNAENGHEWRHVADIPVEDEGWQIGLIVGPSGSGKTSIGRQIWPDSGITDLSAGWQRDRPIIDDIAPGAENMDLITGALSAVGLGDVPAWLRPFNALSNGEQFRAGLARLICEAPYRAVVDEFTSVVDRQIAKIGAGAFAKSWRKTGKQIVLLSCHYDVVEWLQPDWVYDTRVSEVKKKSQNESLSNWKFGRQTEVTGSFLKSIII